MRIANFPLLRGEILKSLSLRQWTYADLARHTGYSHTYVRSIMAGTQSSKRAIDKIVAVLDLPESLVDSDKPIR